MSIKVEIGQEWKHKHCPEIYMVTRTGRGNTYAEGYQIFPKNRMTKVWTTLSLLTDQSNNDWDYLGKPIKCENCNEYCDQHCYIK